MLALLSILFALALLGLTVYALHKYQTMKVEYNVDRSAPLPPLGEDQPRTSLDSSPEIAPKPIPAGNAALKPATKTPAKAKPAANKSRTKVWQDEVATLKSAGKYSEAIAVCEKQLPLWGAYNQLCMLTRNRLKESASAPNPDQSEELLAKLYQTAAVAEFLHDKSGDSDKLTNNQLRKLNLEEVAALDFPYNEIGYAHLRLIRKSDIKLMVETWGRPAGHTTPRQFQANWWQKQVKS